MPDIVGSGNMKWQHIGVFWGIYFAEQSGKTVTTNYLVEISNTRRASILQITKTLEELGLIERYSVLPKHGKGKEYAFKVCIDEKSVHEYLADYFKKRT